jgi:hypothetical protein
MVLTAISIAAGTNACSSRADPADAKGSAGMGTPIALAPSATGMCALDAAGQIACWTTGEPRSVQRAASFGEAVAFDGGERHVCAIRADGSLACGEPPLDAPAQRVEIAARVRQLSVADYSGCVLTEPGEVLCWTPGTTGVDGGPETMQRVALPGPAVQVSHGDHHFCAVLTDGRVFCHGDNATGAVRGDSDFTGPGGYQLAPVPFEGIHDARQVAVTRDATCVLHYSGTVTCAGSPYTVGLGLADGAPNTRGQLELGDVTALVSGVEFTTCALLADGSARCWGQDYCGELSSYSGECEKKPSPFVMEPVLVPGFESVKTVAIGQSICAIDLADQVLCRGLRRDPRTRLWVAAGLYRIPL